MSLLRRCGVRRCSARVDVWRERDGGVECERECERVRQQRQRGRRRDGTGRSRRGDSVVGIAHVWLLLFECVCCRCFVAVCMAWAGRRMASVRVGWLGRSQWSCAGWRAEAGAAVTQKTDGNGFSKQGAVPNKRKRAQQERNEIVCSTWCNV